MKKQLLIFVFILLPIVANADSVEIDGIWYELISKGNAAKVISNPDYKIKYAGDIVIPSKILYGEIEYDVKYINEFAFGDCTNLKSIRIPNSVSTIGESTFHDCINLHAVYIPSSITVIESNAFRECRKLEAVYADDLYSWCKIVFKEYQGANPLCYGGRLYINGNELKDLAFPTDIEYVNPYAFQGCISLTSITIPEGVKGIGNNAFENCLSLKTVHLPNSLEWIGTECFRFDSSIIALSLPDNINSIGLGAFLGCTGITELTIPSKLKEIGRWPFGGMAGLTSLVIPDNIERIGERAFQGCSNLKTLTISKNVTMIDEKAFDGCSELKDVICRADKVPFATADAFQNCYPEFINLYVPKGCVESYKSVIPWSLFGTIKEINEETSINGIRLNENGQEYIFNLEGKAQNKLQKGINIVNGKKYVVK